MAVIALCNDLIFASKIRATGQSLACEVKLCLGLSQLRERLAEAPPPRLIIIDLNCGNTDTPAAVQLCKQALPAVPVLAFLSHVEIHLADAARKAGADQVMARSKFVQVLPTALQGK